MHEVTARIEIPTRTILKVMLVLAALWFVARIGPVLQQVFAGILVAMALYPPVARLQRRGFSKGRAIATVFGVLLLVVALTLGFLIPGMIDEGQEFVDQAPEYLDDGAYWLEDNLPWFYDQLEAWVEGDAGGELDSDAGEPESGTGGEIDAGPGNLDTGEVTDGAPVDADAAINVGQRVVGFIGTAAIALVLAIYILVDGDRAFAWLSRDLSPPMTRRLRRAGPALSTVISQYAVHQIRTSVIAGVYAYVVLAVLGVPSALILATIVAIADAVPLIGVVMSTVPAVIVALTQGWEVALALFLALVAYQVFENYVLIPRLLGRTFHLSSFAMLMAVLIGWKLAGLVGVLLALPTAAALLVVERVWDEDEEDIDVDETEAPGPLATTRTAVNVVADALEERSPETAEEAATPADPWVASESQPGESPPPAAPPTPRPTDGKRSRGGQRRRTKPAAPETSRG